MAIFVITHKVNDFATWKAEYDAFKPQVVEMGIKDHFVLQATDDANNVTVVGEGDLSSIQNFLNSDELKEAMGKSGVEGTPTVFIGENKL